MDGEPMGERPVEEDADMLNFREIALRVSRDEDLDDPFLDGGKGESPTEDRDAVKAILIKHFRYPPDKVADLDDDTCQFTGRHGQPITLGTGNEAGELYLDFTTKGGEKRRLFSSSLKLGVPLAVALAHIPPYQLARIYDKKRRDPHVNELFKIEVNQESSHTTGSRTKVFTLRADNGFRETDSFFGEKR